MRARHWARKIYTQAFDNSDVSSLGVIDLDAVCDRHKITVRDVYETSTRATGYFVWPSILIINHAQLPLADASLDGAPLTSDGSARSLVLGHEFGHWILSTQASEHTFNLETENRRDKEFFCEMFSLLINSIGQSTDVQQWLRRLASPVISVL